jgi:hypothetical protein
VQSLPLFAHFLEPEEEDSNIHQHPNDDGCQNHEVFWAYYTRNLAPRLSLFKANTGIAPVPTSEQHCSLTNDNCLLAHIRYLCRRNPQCINTHGRHH